MGPAPGRKNSVEPLWGVRRRLGDCPQLALPLSGSHSAGLWKCQGWGHWVEGQAGTGQRQPGQVPVVMVAKLGRYPFVPPHPPGECRAHQVGRDGAGPSW